MPPITVLTHGRITLVLMLNTPHSLHGITPRDATPHPRYFINLVAKVAEPLFTITTVAPEKTVAPVEKTLASDIARPRWLRRIWNGLAEGEHGTPIS